MNYYWIKMIHLATVAFNIGFFSLRFYWMLKHSHRVNQRWVRKLSQANDTLLLIAGVAMAWLTHQYPFTHHWLTAKLLALVIYIVAGTLALKRAKRRKSKIFFGLIAYACIGYILSVALTRSPMSWTLLGL